MKRNGLITGKRQVCELLSAGFKNGHVFLTALGDTTAIKLKKNKLKILSKAILNKDYYQIRALLLGKIKNHEPINH